MEGHEMSDSEIIGAHVELPCGRVAPNRLVKSALFEGMADFGGSGPTNLHVGLYRRWGQGGWGIIITGNVQVANDHLTLGRDLCLPPAISKETINAFSALPQAVHDHSRRDKSLILMQLAHAGRQSPRFIGGRSIFKHPVGASDVPLQSPDGFLGQALFSILFPRPKALSDRQIYDIAERFVLGAQLADASGYDGVELHCSHGYLLAQFLSPRTNNRSAPFGPHNNLHLLRHIVMRIRETVPSTFVLAIKLNAADYVKGGLSEEEALDQVRTIAQWTWNSRTCVDIIEISGGDYERPDFINKRNSPRQAFFSIFSRQALAVVKELPNPPRIMLTGSIYNAELIASTIRSSHAELVGLGRPSVAYPLLPETLLAPTSLSGKKEIIFPKMPVSPDPSWSRYVRFINAGLNTAWWVAVMHRQSQMGNQHGDALDIFIDYEQIGAVRSVFELLFLPNRVARMLRLAYVLLGVLCLCLAGLRL